MTDRDKLKALWDWLGEEYREGKWKIHLPALSAAFEFNGRGELVSIRYGTLVRE